MNNESIYTGFIYLWRDKKRNMFYLGSHQGTLDDGYLGSGERFCNAIKKRPADFKRRILQQITFTDRKQLLDIETAWLQLIKREELQTKYYNFKRVATGGNIIHDLSKEKQYIHKMKSIAYVRGLLDSGISFEQSCFYYEELKRYNKWFKDNYTLGDTWRGKKHSDKSKKKMSESAKLRLGPGNRKGTKQSAETKKKISKSNPNRKSINTPYGFFVSAEAFSVEHPDLCTSNGLRNILKKSHNKISSARAHRSKLFTPNDIGKTPHELGWYYIK